ncbi:MAG: hypothetical protein AAGA48_21905 [Myxococcota bacterium]
MNQRNLRHWTAIAGLGAVLWLPSTAHAGCGQVHITLERSTGLVRDGLYGKASDLLAELDPATRPLRRARCLEERGRFFLLRGLASLNTAAYDRAASDFQLAISNSTPTTPRPP